MNLAKEKKKTGKKLKPKPPKISSSTWNKIRNCELPDVPTDVLYLKSLLKSQIASFIC